MRKVARFLLLPLLLLPLRPAINGHNFNDAQSGAKAKDLPGQAQAAASQKAEYITILMGSNDLCTSSAWTMTSADSFRTSIGQPLATLNQISPFRKYAQICRYDNGAFFSYQFPASDVSVLDYFHPSLQGQANLANITWGASYWSSQETPEESLT